MGWFYWEEKSAIHSSRCSLSIFDTALLAKREIPKRGSRRGLSLVCLMDSAIPWHCSCSNPQTGRTEKPEESPSQRRLLCHCLLGGISVFCAVESASPFNCAAWVPLVARSVSNILLTLEPELCCGRVRRWILLLLHPGRRGMWGWDLDGSHFLGSL